MMKSLSKLTNEEHAFGPFISSSRREMLGSGIFRAPTLDGVPQQECERRVGRDEHVCEGWRFCD